MDDINQALDTLKSMLATEDGQKTLSSLMNSIGGGAAPASAPEPAYEDAEQEYSPSAAGGANFADALGSLSKYSDIFASVQNSSNAPRMQLLSALKPYLSNRRQQRFGTIMNLMRYSDVPGAIAGKLRNK